MTLSSIFKKWVLAAAIALAALTPARAEQDVVVGMVDEPAPPYSVGVIGSTSKQGLAFELMNEIFLRLGWKTQIELHPWSRCLKMMQLGVCDAMPLLMKTPDRAKYMVFSVPVLTSRELFFYNTVFIPGFKWKTWQDLKPYKIGLVRGYAYGEEFTKAIKEFRLKVEYANDQDISLRKLAAGRIDLYLGDELMTNYVISRTSEWRQIIQPDTGEVSSYSYHIGISSNSWLATRLGPVNQAIMDARKEGRLAEIINNYLGY